MPYVLDRALLYDLPNAPMLMQFTLQILISWNLRLTLLSMFFSRNARLQAILGFNCIVKEDSFIRIGALYTSVPWNNLCIIYMIYKVLS